MGGFKFVLLLRNLHVPLCGKCFDSCNLELGVMKGFCMYEGCKIVLLLLWFGEVEIMTLNLIFLLNEGVGIFFVFYNLEKWEEKF
jgi:hypothetical protein